ncbi:MAG: 30S ribosomal protein S20 [Dehalococcoidia bacterium]
MAQHSSAKKAARQEARQRLRNRSVRSTIKTHVRKAELLIGNEELAEADIAVHRALRVLDRAAKKGVIHHSNAARRKSRLMLRLNAAKVAASAN